MKIKIAKIGSQYNSDFLPGQFFNSKRDIVKAAEERASSDPEWVDNYLSWPKEQTQQLDERAGQIDQMWTDNPWKREVGHGAADHDPHGYGYIQPKQEAYALEKSIKTDIEALHRIVDEIGGGLHKESFLYDAPRFTQMMDQHNIQMTKTMLHRLKGLKFYFQKEIYHYFDQNPQIEKQRVQAIALIGKLEQDIEKHIDMDINYQTYSMKMKGRPEDLENMSKQWEAKNISKK